MGKIREMWAASFKPPQELWRLEYNGALDLALFVSKTKVIQDRWNPANNTEDPFGRAPIYHVWKGDDWLYCGPDMRAAYNEYEKQTRATQCARRWHAMKLYCTDCRYLEKRPVRAEVPLDSGNYQETGWRYVCNLTGKSFQAMSVPEYDYCFHGELVAAVKGNEEVYK